MNGFLDELERELVAAHPRRGRARRRALAGRASLALVLVAVVGIAGVFVLSVGRESQSGGSASAPPAQPVPAPQPLPSTAPPSPTEPMPSLPPDSVAVLAGTDVPGVVKGVADVIRARYDVGYLGVSARRDATRTVVFHEPPYKRAAELIAMDLGASLAPMDDTARDAARGALIAVETGRDILSASGGPLRRPGDGAARGEIAALKFDDRTIVTLRAQLTRGRNYAVWGRRADARPKFFGFIPEVRSSRRLTRISFSIGAPARARSIFITAQRAARTPRAPGKAILTADLPR